MKRRRILLTALLALLILGAALVLLAQRIRNAPLAIGSGDTTPAANTLPEGTAEASGEIPFGTPGRDMALMSNKDGTWDIFVLSAGGTLTNLTPDNDAAFDYFPSWSLDGEQLNFLSNRLNAGELGPSQMNADGTDLKNLDILSAVMATVATGRFDWDPAWSPDGSQLLWASLRDLNLELYLIDTAAAFEIGNARNLTQSGARDWFAAWSPDGTQISFSSHDAGNENVYVLNPETAESVQITENAWDELRAAWSSTGDTLLYVSDENDMLLEGTVNLNLMGVDGSRPRPIENEIFEGGAVWSPDGSQVASVSNVSGNWQIYVMNADGSAKRRITEPGADYLYPVWKP